jgi:cytochrome b561
MRHPRPDSIRLKRFHRYFLYAVLALLFFSGAAWACFNYFLTTEDVAAAKAWALKVHGAAAMVTLVLIGTILTAHVRFAWRASRNRSSGSLFLGAFGILTVTGYGLYYAAGERLRAWTSWIHLGVGLAVPILLVVHILLGKGTRTPSHATKTPPFPLKNRHQKQLKIELREGSG